MKRCVSVLLLLLLFVAVVSVGCGGGGSDDSSVDSEQTESLTEDTGGEETGDYDPNAEGRGVSSGTISVHLELNSFRTQVMILYGRKSLGRNSDGSYKLGDWEEVKSFKSFKYEKVWGNQDFTISNEYVEFGFNVLASGSLWAYSDVFWTEADTRREQPQSIYIELFTSNFYSSYVVNVRIKVNNKEVVYIPEILNDKQNRMPGGFTSTTFKFGYPNWYTAPHTLYGRKFLGTRADGSKKMGPWVNLISYKPEYLVYALGTRYTGPTHLASGVTESEFDDDKHTLYCIPKDYVEFGFEFDVKDGTDWPYSDVFWTLDKGSANKIFIDTGGGVRNAWIEIYVNGNRIVNDINCDSHSQHDWSDGSIKVEIKDTGAFTTKSRNFRARKPGGGWETLINKEQGTGTKIVSKEYVDFGFEFDITSGPDWPYSHAFWKAADHPGCEVTYIYIEISGYLSIFGDPHLDIVVQGYNAAGYFGTLYTYSNHDLDDDYVVTGW